MTALDSPEHVQLRNHLHWETALDRLELDVILAERLLEDPTRSLPEPWDEPQLNEPIPADLRERAIALAERQRRVQARLAAAMANTSREHEFTSRVERATRRPDVPVYLDLRA